MNCCEEILKRLNLTLNYPPSIPGNPQNTVQCQKGFLNFEFQLIVVHSVLWLQAVIKLPEMNCCEEILKCSNLMNYCLLKILLFRWYLGCYSVSVFDIQLMAAPSVLKLQAVIKLIEMNCCEGLLKRSNLPLNYLPSIMVSRRFSGCCSLSQRVFKFRCPPHASTLYYKQSLSSLRWIVVRNCFSIIRLSRRSSNVLESLWVSVQMMNMNVHI